MKALEKPNLQYQTGHASFVACPVIRITETDLREQLRLANRLVYSLRGIIMANGYADRGLLFASIAKDLKKWEEQQL